MNNEEREKHPRVSCGFIENPILFAIIPMKRLKNIRPSIRLLNLKQCFFEVSKEASNTRIKSPEKDRSDYVSGPKHHQNNSVHRAEFYGSRSSQQNAQNNEVMIETGDALFGDHIEMLPRSVVLFYYGHIVLQNSVISTG